jgi:hypothetical protein
MGAKLCGEAGLELLAAVIFAGKLGVCSAVDVVGNCTSAKTDDDKINNEITAIEVSFFIIVNFML